MDYLLLLSSIVLGAASVFLFKLYEPRHIKLLNAFTGAYLLCLTILHLLPELYHPHNGSVIVGASLRLERWSADGARHSCRFTPVTETCPRLQ